MILAQLEQIGAGINNTSISSSATLTIEAGAHVVVIQPRTNAVYVTQDGTTPSSTNGTKISPDAQGIIDVFYAAGGTPSTVIKVIEATASASVYYYSAKFRMPYKFP
jgi:hypothetical protein